MSKKFALLVTGGRDFADEDRIHARLDRLLPDLVLCGGATGADELARRWAEDRQIPFLVSPARWREHKKAAGPIRNSAQVEWLLMLQSAGWKVRVLATVGGSGTADQVKKAKRAGLKILHL